MVVALSDHRQDADRIEESLVAELVSSGVPSLKVATGSDKIAVPIVGKHLVVSWLWQCVATA